MSVLFGRWNLDGRPVELEYLKRVRDLLAHYGPDGEGTYIKDGAAILYRGFHTSPEANFEAQPFTLSSGEVLTWDGRLDNRSELAEFLKLRVPQDLSDGNIVARAYEVWGMDSLARLTGDWALAVWNPVGRSLTLAKDPIGTRHLFYSSDRARITWSTILDPLILFEERTFELEEEYLAGWLAMFPAAQLTPYAGVFSVPPSHFVRLEPGRTRVSRYWDFDPSDRIRYANDRDYEEHFRTLFRESVRRRIRSGSQVLAELSGGMDSSSIVCMADAILAEGGRETPGLDTISYFDDSEPNWNERPYVEIVERKRGRAGCHIDLGFETLLTTDCECEPFAPTPASGPGRITQVERRFADCLSAQGNRVVLSGIGGDEVAGGVPTPTPELMDLIASARLGSLARQLKLWALSKRVPWIHLFFEALRGFFPPALLRIQSDMRPPCWVRASFVRRFRAAFTSYSTRTKLLGAKPSFQADLSTLDALRRQLACSPYPSRPLFEKRYPFLDRHLLEFLYAIPREQLVRPGQRRSLMRRAMAGTVPDELLNRRRKASASRRPTLRLVNEYAALTAMSETLESASLGIVDPALFRETIHRASEGDQIHIVAVLRTLALESWLRAIQGRGILQCGVGRTTHPSLGDARRSTPSETRSFHAAQSA